MAVGHTSLEPLTPSTSISAKNKCKNKAWVCVLDMDPYFEDDSC